MADLEQNGRLDIVYTDRLSGEVGVLENLGGGSVRSPVLYRAGPGPYGVTGTADPSPVSSLEGTTSVAVGTFTPDGLPSLVALNPGSNTLGVLSGLGDGRLSNPTYLPDAGHRAGGPRHRLQRRRPDRTGRPQPRRTLHLPQ